MPQSDKGAAFAMRSAHQSSAAPNEVDSSHFYTADELWPYLTDADRIVLREEVSTAINHELAHGEDLGLVIPRLLRSCVSEAQELRRAIKSLASSQTLEGHRAVQIIKEGSKRIEHLREVFVKQGNIISQMDVTSGSYEQLRKLHHLRRNVASVIDWVELLNELRHTNMYELVERRQFAEAYRKLCRLQFIRRTVEKEFHSHPNEQKSSYDPYFEKLYAVQTMFVESVYKLFRECSVHAAIQKALEDPPRPGGVTPPVPGFTQLEECVQLCADEITEGKGCLHSSDGTPLITEDRVFQEIASCSRKMWTEDVMAELTDPIANSSAYLERMKKISPLLLALELTLVPLSTKLSLFSAVVVALHGEIVKALERFTAPEAEVEANNLIAASEFVQWYKEMMRDGNYSSFVDITALDKLSASMTVGTVDGLMSHLVQLCTACAKTALREGNAARGKQHKLPMTNGPKDMFAVLQQTLGGLSSAIDVDVMRQISGATAAAIEGYLLECKLGVDYDEWMEREANQKGDKKEVNNEWKDRRLEFLYAFCNDCSIIERNMDTIELIFVSHWSEKDCLESALPFEGTQLLLSEYALYYVDEVILHVEQVVEGQWSFVFRPGAWYSEEDNPVQVILDTVADFIDEEFAVMLEEARRRAAAQRMMQRFILKCLTVLMEVLGDALRHPNSKGIKDWNEFINCFARDIALIIDMWRKRVVDGREQLISTATKALELAKSLLAVNKQVDFDFIVQKDLLDDFGDFPTFAMRFMLKPRRKDIGEDKYNAMMALWSERIAHQKRDAADRPTTGWKQTPSYFGQLDRTLADSDVRGGLFGASPVRKRKKAEQKRQKMEKEKRKAEHERHLSDVTAMAKTKQTAVPLIPKTNTEVEVVSLAEVLGK